MLTRVLPRVYRSLSSTRLLHYTVVHRSQISLNNVPASSTRNIGIIAHIDAGKTTTTERMLFYSGRIKRIGNVDEGDTVTDYLASERARGITIQLAAITIPWNNHKINIIDTPGHADFTFEVIRSLRVLDGAVTILDGVAGVEAQTEKVWKQADNLKIPKVIYVNKMDRPGAGFSRTVKEVVTRLQTRVVLCTVPYFETVNGDFVFAGVLDILHCKLLKWDPKQDATGTQISVHDLDDTNISNVSELEEIVCKSRESMVETLGELDERVVDSFLDHDADYMKVPTSVLISAIRRETIKNNVCPVFCGASFRNIGIQPLLDGIINFLPSPLECPAPQITVSQGTLSKIKKPLKKASGTASIVTSMDPTRGLIVDNNPNFMVAFAFKVMTHATRGVMTFFRVYSGKLFTNTTAVNTRTKKKLLITSLLLMHGDCPESVKYLTSGNIGVILGHEDDIVTGDTLVSLGPGKKHLSERDSNLTLLPIEVPPPLFNSGIEPMTAGDQGYMNECIRVLTREDPSLQVRVDEEMGQTILSGMGELHLEIVRDRLVKDMKAKVRLRDVAVSYKETLLKLCRHESTCTSPDGAVSVTVQLESFEGPSEATDYAKEEGAQILDQDNNILIFEAGSTPLEMYQAIADRRWKSPHQMQDLLEVITQGCMAGLQMGGPIMGLALHSMVVRVKSWRFPFDGDTHGPVDVMNASRRAVVDAVKSNQDQFGFLEPVMETRVYVGSDTVGEVSHDLSHRCQAVIISVQDESSQNIEALTWAKEEGEKVYLPPDYTLSQGQGLDLRNRKTIVAETPLREMIGYLLRLRSLTQGRGTFDMTYMRMSRVAPSRANLILQVVGPVE